MRQLPLLRLALPALLIALPLSAQTVRTDFREYSSPVTREYPAAIGAPLVSGGLDFYQAPALNPPTGGANVLGTWGTADAGAVNRPSNISGSTALFATVLGSEVDIFAHGSDVVFGNYIPFSLFSIDVAHLYSNPFSSIALAPVSFRVSAFGEFGGGAPFFQDFLIPLPPLVNGVRTPVLQTLTFDSRFRNVANVYFYQGSGSGTATQFTNVVSAVAPEPSSVVLLATGLIGVLGAAGRRRRQSARTA